MNNITLTITAKDIIDNNMSENILDFLKEDQKELYLLNRDKVGFTKEVIAGRVAPFNGGNMDGLFIQMSW